MRSSWSGADDREGTGSSTEGSTFTILMGAVLIAALAVRGYLLVRFYATPDADQTILALMARHVEQGERPLFYWGQPYTGSLDAYLVAPLFAIFGQRDVLLHLPPLAASLAFSGLTVALAWRLYGRGVALLCGIYLSLAPQMLVEWSVWAGSGYLEAMALGTAALLLTLPRESGISGGWSRLMLAFFLLGFGLWVQPIAAYYVLAVLATLLGRMVAVIRVPNRWPAGLTVAAGSFAAFVLGAAPLILFNAQHNGATLTFLTNRSTHLDLATVLARVLLWAGPVLIGMAPPTTNRIYFDHFLLDHYAFYGVALALLLLILLRGLLCWRLVLERLRGIFSPSPAHDTGLLVLLILLVAGFLSSSWGTEQWSASQPRYLLPMYTVLPLLVRVLLPWHPRRWQWPTAVAVLLLVGACNLYVNTATFGRADPRLLATLLQSRGITAVYGDYWLVVPLIYDSDERLSGIAVGDDLGTLHNNRYGPYLRRAALSSHIAWVVTTGSPRQRSVLACLSHLGSHYETLGWQDQTIYDHPTGSAFPWWNGGKCPTEP